MRINKLLLIFLFLVFCFGCKKQEKIFVGENRYGLEFKHEFSFPATEPLIELFGVYNMDILDTLLMVRHPEASPTHYWEIYNLNNLEHIKSVLREGRGPNEVLFAYYAGQYKKIDGKRWIYFLDYNSSRFIKFNLDRSLQSENDDLELIAHINTDKAPYYILDHDSFIYRYYDPDEGSINLVQGDNSWENPAKTKKIYRNITLDDYHKLRQHSILYNEKNQKVCIKPSYVDHIQIIDLEGDDDMILSTAAADNWPQVRNNKDFETLTLYYSGIKITDDYIFALYTNKMFSEMGEKPKETEIHVFSWDGDAVAKLRFEDYITVFAVDSEKQVLYGLDNLELLYAYDISSCFDSDQQ